MPPTGRVVLVSDDPETAELVGLALEGRAVLTLVHSCSDLTELAAYLATEPADAVLIDLGPAPEKTLAELDPLICAFADVCPVVLADSTDDNLVFKAMEAGARYLLPKESISSKLAPVLEKLIPSKVASPKGEGHIITVLSAGGGCGATTLAVNLADELRVLASAHVLLVDMDFAYGSVATYLGLAGKHGLADVLNRRGTIDPELIRSSALSYSDDIHVLVSPSSVDPLAEQHVAFDRLGETLEICMHTYKYTVVDAPRVSMDVAAEVAKWSVLTLLLFQRVVKDVRVAKILLDGLAEQGIAADQIMLIVGRYSKASPTISIDQCRAALGRTSLELVNDDFRSAVRSINLGRPLSSVAPRSLLRKDVSRIAKKIARIKRAGER